MMSLDYSLTPWVFFSPFFPFFLYIGVSAVSIILRGWWWGKGFHIFEFQIFWGSPQLVCLNSWPSFLVLWLFFDSCPFPEASFVSVVEGRNERGSRDFQEKPLKAKVSFYNLDISNLLHMWVTTVTLGGFVRNKQARLQVGLICAA